eukprot:11084356-Ditylum_brightwellii.AAC.2
MLHHDYSNSGSSSRGSSRNKGDTGSNLFGVIALEVWVLSEDQTWLVQPDGGWWHSPYYDEDGGHLERPENDLFCNYVKAWPLVPLQDALPHCHQVRDSACIQTVSHHQCQTPPTPKTTGPPLLAFKAQCGSTIPSKQCKQE